MNRLRLIVLSGRIVPSLIGRMISSASSCAAPLVRHCPIASLSYNPLVDDRTLPVDPSRTTSRDKRILLSAPMQALFEIFSDVVARAHSEGHEGHRRGLIGLR